MIAASPNWRSRSRRSVFFASYFASAVDRFVAVTVLPVQNDAEVAAGESRCGVGNVLAPADQVDLEVTLERLAELRQAVTASRDEDANLLPSAYGCLNAHLGHSELPPISCSRCEDLRPSPRTDSGVSTLSGLSAASFVGRSWSDQSPFFRTNRSFAACVSVTARRTAMAEPPGPPPPVSFAWVLSSVGAGLRTRTSRSTTRLATRSFWPSLYLMFATTSILSPSLSVPARSWCLSPGTWKARRFPVSSPRAPFSARGRNRRV